MCAPGVPYADSDYVMEIFVLHLQIQSFMKSWNVPDNYPIISYFPHCQVNSCVRFPMC